MVLPGLLILAALAVGDPADAAALIEQLRSDDSAEREKAADALVEFCAKADAPTCARTLDLLTAETKSSEAVIVRVRGELDRQIADLVRQLGDDVQPVRQSAQDALIALGSHALAAVRKTESDEDAEVAWRKKEIARVIELGPWKKILKERGFLLDGAREIEPTLAERFFPNDRFFTVPGPSSEESDVDEFHLRVSRNGTVIQIALSSGGDITAIIGAHRPLLSTDNDVADFLKLVVALRYGFSAEEYRGLKPEQKTPGVWTARVSIRTFTVTLDDTRRVQSVTME